MYQEIFPEFPRPAEKFGASTQDFNIKKLTTKEKHMVKSQKN